MFQHFYYRTIRRSVIAFGTMFKNIQLVRYAKDTFDEIDRINIPLSYMSKENFVKRLYENPDLHKATQINLPRMTFEMTDIEYDSSRKITSVTKTYSKIATDNTSASIMYTGVPYNLYFELNIFARNVEDSTQIVEQILPYFNPDYTLTVSYIDGNESATKDVPIILENISHVRDEDGPAETTVRTIVWTLKFKMKSYFFGPANNSKIIRKSNANISINSTSNNTAKLTLSSGNKNYRVGEPVYQGGISWSESQTIGTVANWDSINKIITISTEKGVFDTSSNIIGTLTNTSRSVVSAEPYDGLMATIMVTPNPLSANIGDDFGFTETIYEFPNI